MQGYPAGSPQFDLTKALDASQVMVCDLGGVIYWWSGGLEMLYGWTASEAVGRISHELLGAEYPMPREEIETELLRTGYWTGEVKYRRQDGGSIWVTTHWTLQRDASGTPGMVVKTSSDITRRKHIEEELKLSERRFRALVESNPLPVSEVRYGGRVLRANKAFLDLVGITREEFEHHGLDVSEVTPREWMRAIEPALAEAFEARSPILYEKEYLRRDGTRIPVAVGLCWSNMAAGEALAFVMDLTEQKRTEQALRQSEQRFRLVVESAPSGMLMVDEHGIIVLVNSQVERIFQYSREEMIGQTVDFLIPESYRPRHAAQQDNYFRAPRARRMGTGPELFARRKDGTEFAVEIGLTPIETPDGPMVLSAIVDITDRVQAAQALRESEERFRTLVETIPGIVFTADAAGNNTFSNPESEKYTGVPAEELRGDGWLEVVHPDDRERARAAWNAGAQTGCAYDVEYRFLRADGVYRWQLGRVVPLRTAQGHVNGWMGICTDIDDQKRVASQLETLVRERTSALEAALAEKTVLLKEVHHRVKNNLAIISSLLRMQARNTTDAGATHGLEDSHRRVQAMARVHEHLYGTEQLDRINFAEYLRQLAEELYSSMVPETRPIRLRVDTDPIELALDRAIPCGLIVNELLSNAFKHAFPAGRTGEVRVGLARAKEALGVLEVRDDGIGIPSEVDWKRPQSLGMRIIQVLAKQMDGTIELESDGGTVFRLTFPLG
jgi:PAS domain S-box-containing protein